jgi:photosystem II stability/assembly factor-like uncharacterized protein
MAAEIDTMTEAPPAATRVRTFLATTGKGIARASRDPDGAWQVEHLLPGTDVRCLSADPLNPGVVYAGTQGSGVLRSDDYGSTWRPAGLEGEIVKSIAASPTQAGTVYAGTKPAYMHVSRDGGATWRELRGFRRIPGRWWWRSPAETPFTAYVQAIALSPTDPNIVLAGIEAGAVVRSEDGGRTWSRHVPDALRDCHTLTFHASDGNWAYEGGGTGHGFAVSRDGGRTWRKHHTGLDRAYGWAAAADPARPDIWYASLSPGPSKAHSSANAQAYIFRSVGGRPWEKLSGGLPQPLDHMPYALITDADAPGHLYAGLSNGDIWHTTDHGDTWRRLPVNLSGIHQTLIAV